MNPRIDMQTFLAWSIFALSALFILALTVPVGGRYRLGAGVPRLHLSRRRKRSAILDGLFHDLAIHLPQVLADALFDSSGNTILGVTDRSFLAWILGLRHGAPRKMPPVG